MRYAVIIQENTVTNYISGLYPDAVSLLYIFRLSSTELILRKMIRCALSLLSTSVYGCQ